MGTDVTVGNGVNEDVSPFAKILHMAMYSAPPMSGLGGVGCFREVVDNLLENVGGQSELSHMSDEELAECHRRQAELQKLAYEAEEFKNLKDFDDFCIKYMPISEEDERLKKIGVSAAEMMYIASYKYGIL